VSHFVRFTTAHLCPLGPRVHMNCSKLSALTTRRRFHGVSLDLLLFLELVYRGPQHHIYIWIRICFELPVMVLKVLSPPSKGCGCVASDGWQVYLLTVRFSVKLVDLLDGLSARLLRSRKLLSPSLELDPLRYG
jgi:hypothetical protein